MIDKWYNLEIGNVLDYDDDDFTKVIRVPGGWIHRSVDVLRDFRTNDVIEIASTAVFVPYIEKDKA